MTREDAKRILACRGNGYSEEDFNNALEVVFNSIPSLLSDVNEAVDKYTDNPANYLEYSDDGWEDKTDIDYVERAFKAGAEWMQSNLWKSADGDDDLPELEREVVVFTQNFPNDAGIMKVSIAHRPNPKGWNGRNILTGEVEHFVPKTYGKGGWSMPDVKWWLDAPLPFKEGGEE